MPIPACEYVGCKREAEWRMVAGTGACDEIMEQVLCDEHCKLFANIPNAPHYISDSHGHTCEEVAFQHFYTHERKYCLNDNPFMCEECGAKFLEEDGPKSCQMDHAIKRLEHTTLKGPSIYPTVFTPGPLGPLTPIVPQPVHKCVCGEYYATVKQVQQCAASHQRYGCTKCGQTYSHGGDAEKCCKKSNPAAITWEGIKKFGKNMKGGDMK